MHADPTLPVVKVKSVEVTINATVDVAYVDDFDDERNEEYIDRQVKDAVRKANIETSELVDLELDDY
ncbi:hypothetical protein [Salinicoccus roseus]|uniref:Uncharacterized protein n=1 Tax=Salinicoccus roseus TaxID=45670 RepID=A0A0C2E397_9STAP|nr:hypothetical protein [Salinicoccus roseus]KIH69917.1 hypothetical protein SN16_10385 [Salinicoccus roseus]MDB0581204.1 hypothetical protein [Salinicoccus roseus]